MADQVAQYREQLIDAVVETDEALMERYLESGEAPAEDVAKALKTAVTRGEIFPVAAGVATKNLGTDRAARPARRGRAVARARRSPSIDLHEADTAAFVFKTVADPFAGRINVFRARRARSRPTRTLVNARDHAKERTGSLMLMQGKEHDQRARSARATSARSRS